MNQKIRFKFCGGCNPLYDRKKVYENIKFIIKSNELFTNLKREYIIVLNGCQRGCIKIAELNEDLYIVINTQNYLIKDNIGDIDNISNWIVKNISYIENPK